MLAIHVRLNDPARLNQSGHIRDERLDCFIISSPGRSLGRAIVLSPASASASALALAAASALAKSLTSKFFLCDGQIAVRRAILSL